MISPVKNDWTKSYNITHLGEQGEIPRRDQIKEKAEHARLGIDAMETFFLYPVAKSFRIKTVVLI